MSESLRQEMEHRIEAANRTECRHGTETPDVCLTCAVAVAVELVERERRIRWMMEGAQRANIELRKAAEKRAEAAEAALAERGHVRGCFCHDTDCEGLYCTGNDRACLHRIMVADPRCAKGGSR